AVGDAAGVDVEHVDLAVDGEVRAVGADQDRGVGSLLPLLSALGDAAGEQVDAKVAGPATRRRQARAVERLGAGGQLLPSGQQVPLLGQDDEFGPITGSRTYQALGGGEIAILFPVRVQLYGGNAQRGSPLVD